METTLDELFAQAYSIESKPDDRDVDYAGDKIIGLRVYRLYVDKEGKVWYKTKFINQDTGEMITDEEKIFDRNLKKCQQKRRSAWHT